jgi:hypothetical protein
MAGFSTFARDVDQGKPLPHSVEPWERFNAYARRINLGQPQPRYLEYHAGRKPYPRDVIELCEYVDDEN